MCVYLWVLFNIVSQVKLTQYSHGAGCGCKIAPKLLKEILKSSVVSNSDPRLLVGNETSDDAAVFDLGDGRSVISTTDFFTPIVDDPFKFGQIAATNAISDIYAMGGSPLMAVAILCWPVNKLDAEIASQVIDGGRHACQLAGINLAGGHSIDAPEPIFGLAVTGQIKNCYLKRNNEAKANNQLFLTKPLGIGILTTAAKKNLLKSEHSHIAVDTMCQLNSIGEAFGRQPYVTAMTDVTGFGLLGHLLEICQGSNLRAQIDYDAVPKLAGIDDYISLDCSPGGAYRNYESYGHHLADMNDIEKKLLCDPQTSGGLLVAVDERFTDEFIAFAQTHYLELSPIGRLLATEKLATAPLITIN